MKEYNLLTQRLLSEGYTKEKHPDYVRLQNASLEVFDTLGGFEYTLQYIGNKVYSTGCGLLVKGSYWSSGHMSYMGIDWRLENDNPVINCPYRKDDCKMRHELLNNVRGGGLCKFSGCDCHMVDTEYNYGKSLKKIYDDIDKERTRQYHEFSEKVNEHVCHWHMHYNEWEKKWQQVYDPMTCARYCQNAGGVCSLRHVPVSAKKGNVFYDVKTTSIRRDGTLFDGEKIVDIRKGKRLFERNVSLTICEEAAKRCVKEINEKETGRHHVEMVLQGLKVEVLSIRAERRESRDLMQDLEDIKAGIHISHESDAIKRKKEEKSERRKLAQKKKIEKLEKKILEVGYENLEDHSIDKIHADKWLTEDRIEELEDERDRRIKSEQEKPAQLSMFDYPEVMP